MTVVNDAGADALFGFRVVPEPARLSHITVAVGLHGERHAHETAHGNDGAVRIERRGVNQRIQSAARPKLLAGLWIVRCYAFRPGHNQFLAAIHFDDNRRAP